MIYLMCYDIRDQKRLRRCAKYLEKYGMRIQRSFFQAEISEKQLKKIWDTIAKILDKNADYFFIYPLCDTCANKAITDGTGSIYRVKKYEVL